MLIQIVAGTFLAGVVSVCLAWVLSKSFLSRYPQHMLSLAAGALLATAFISLMPEAFESEYSAHFLFMLFLFGLLVVIVLDKAEVWHHAHEHGKSGRQETHKYHDHSHASIGGWSVLFGDGLHAFADGILIASAILADRNLGLGTAFAVLLHEVPHHMGDLAVVSSGTSQPRKALLKVSLAGSMTVVGGLAGYLFVWQLVDWLPLLLVFAASSFAYVALSDIIPRLNTPMKLSQMMVQVSWLLIGSILVTGAVAVVGRHVH